MVANAIALGPRGAIRLSPHPDGPLFGPLPQSMSLLAPRFLLKRPPPLVSGRKPW